MRESTEGDSRESNQRRPCSDQQWPDYRILGRRGLKSGRVERVSVDDVENGLYSGFGAIVANTVSAVHTGILMHRARVEGNGIETAARAIFCNLSCFATANIVNGSQATIDDAASGRRCRRVISP
jgi:hypothetical protein